MMRYVTQVRELIAQFKIFQENRDHQQLALSLLDIRTSAD